MISIRNSYFDDAKLQYIFATYLGTVYNYHIFSK